MWDKKIWQVTEPIELENGHRLQEVEVAYYQYGPLLPGRPVIWVFHAFSGSAEVHDWWHGIFGKGRLLDPEHFTIICANVLGSCYGTTGPTSINPATGSLYGADFPQVSVRDIAKLHIRLRKHLGISKIYLGLGGSMGGQQLLQWAVLEPTTFQHMVIISANARHSPWGIGFSELQRWALELGEEGIKLARAIGMMSFRSPDIFNQSQDGKWPDGQPKVATYLRYQGQKFADRFDPNSYRILLNAMDNHQLAASANETTELLSSIYIPSLIVSIKTDILFPMEEQAFLATHLARAQHVIINSEYGHDGFLVETDELQENINAFLKNNEKLKI
jgi:homoserine O-acetyltransferase/O-succinyltransferase